MNKGFSVVFIFAYLGISFFCIFERIHAWPFSDYSAYQYYYHPKYVTLYIPYLKLSDGSYVPPDITEFNVNTLLGFFFKSAKLTPFISKAYFFDVFFSHEYQDRYMDKTLKSKFMREIVKRMNKKGLQPVKFVSMQVRFIEERKHKWTPIYIPGKEYDIP